jgi:hypothetical protein
MRPSAVSRFDPDRRDVQFCVRECAVFKFRGPDAPPAPPRRGPLLFAAGPGPSELVLLPPGQLARAVAFQVSGEAMRGLADPGALIYFEDPRTPPTPDMLGHVVVVQTGAEEVLARRLLRGSRAGLFDLESRAAAPARDVPVRWAAHISAIIPPLQARRIAISGPCGTSLLAPRCLSRSGRTRE